MTYTPTTWSSGDTVTSAKLNKIEQGIKGLETQIGGLGVDYEVVDDYQGLLASTADKVLVLHNDSPMGNTNKSCWFKQSDVWTFQAYTRNNGTKVYPMPSTELPKPTDVPKQAIYEVLKTWVGNTNVIHGESYSDHYNTLFAPECEADQTTGKYVSDCITFIESILLGITYQHSRYILGKDKDNIQFNYPDFPETSVPELFGKGGLGLYELARYFAERGQLYEFPTNPVSPQNMVQIGDILFRGNATNFPNRYYNIEHAMIVVATFPQVEYIVMAESAGFSPENYEQTDLHMNSCYLSAEIGRGDIQIFARPDYSKYLNIAKDTFVPCGDGSYKMNCFFMPRCGVSRGNIDSPKIPESQLYFGRYYACTPEYYPVIPNSIIEYTGVTSNDRDNYSLMVHQYDNKYNLLRTDRPLANAVATPVTLSADTYYIRFTHYMSHYNTTIGLNLNDLDDIGIKITPPSTN